MSAKTMAEVLEEHPDWWWGATEGKAHCDKCEWSQACDPRTADNAFRAHQAEALTAAGFGFVADAWDDGFTTCGYEHTKQRTEPTHPITRINPYRATA